MQHSPDPLQHRPEQASGWLLGVAPSITTAANRREASRATVQKEKATVASVTARRCETLDGPQVGVPEVCPVARSHTPTRPGALDNPLAGVIIGA
jgi:hypothetical protein